jgi:two-component system, cell cycle sensor histidine kinase and response regulator CckA
MTDNSNLTVLIVDDTEMNIDILVGALDQDYNISVAMDGESALQTVTENPPDLILLDIMMPNMNGYQVCEKLKSEDKTRDIPIIFLTALSEEQDEVRGLQLGAVDYIIKPFNPELVKAKVRNHLELKRHRDPLEVRRSLSCISKKWNSKEIVMNALDALKPVIMIIDDEENVIDILVETLKDTYDISVAMDGESALQAITENPPDLILLDVIMPGMDGYEICRRLKAEERTKSIPVIFVTVMDEVADEAMGFELGAVDYIAKPVSPSIVQARVRNHLELEMGRKTLEKVNMELRETKNRELQESEAKYLLHFENVLDLIFSIDRELTVKTISPSVKKILGYEPEDLIGKPFQKLNLMDERYLEQAVADVMRILSGESVNLTIYEIFTKEGKKIFAEITWSPILKNGAIIGIIAVARDVTERKKAEVDKKKLQEQLWQSQKMEAIGRLSGGIAHDFNNLLTVIIGSAEMALMGFESESYDKGFLNSIKEAGEKAAILTRQLLAFSRKQVFQAEVFNLNDAVYDMDKMLRRLIGENIELKTHLSPETCMIETDRGQVEQIIMNLAVNAKDAMPEGGKLIIETTKVELDEEYADSHIILKPGFYEMMAISDTGIGMTNEVKSHLFEPFFTTKEKGKGTGLGLSIVYGIVNQSNGFIWVYSEPGMGTTFKIYFPRVDKTDVDIKKMEKEPEAPINGSETILVVEDDSMTREIIKMILNKSGYKVLFAANSGEAINISEEHKEKIDLILTDLVMPGMGGRELANLLVDKRKEMKVLYMSGYTDNTISHNGILEKGINFIQKPFTTNGLNKKLREVLEDSH